MRWSLELIGQLLLAAAYGSAASAGVTALVAGSEDPITSTAGAVAGIVGGCLAMVSLPRGLWWLERTGLILVAAAAVVRIVLNLRAWPVDLADAPQSVRWLVMVLCGLALRAIIIRGYELAPPPRTPAGRHHVG